MIEPLPVTNLIAICVIMIGFCSIAYFIFKEKFEPLPPLRIEKPPKKKKVLKRLQEIKFDFILGKHCTGDKDFHFRNDCDCQEILEILEYIETGELKEDEEPVLEE